MDTTAVKALRALEWLCQRESPCGVTEMCVALGLTKSNAHRILSTLSKLGFARAVGGGKYIATLKTWEIGNAVLGRVDVKGVAGGAMRALAEETGETVHLSILDGAEVVYIDKVDGSQPVRAYSHVGGRAPAYAVATGKALLAYHKSVESLLPRQLQRFTRRTIDDREKLLRELEVVRKRDYAINRGEWRDGVGGVAAPIRIDTCEVVSAVGLSGPTARLTPDRLRAMAPIVLDCALSISMQLGYRPKLHANPCATLVRLNPKTDFVGHVRGIARRRGGQTPP